MAGAKGKEAENAAEASSGPGSLANKIKKDLKPKAKIVKKKINKLKGTPQVQGEKSNKKNKIVLESNKERSKSGKENEKKLNLSEIKQKSIAYEEQNVTIRMDRKTKFKKENEKKVNLSKIKHKSIAYKEQNDKSQQDHKSKDELHLGSSQRKQHQRKNKKHSGLEKQQSQMNKEKYAEFERNQHKEMKNEKLGGLIFMCNAKTKPDCFRHRVMGVPISKKDLVLGVKPGLKLFLYDFDLRLMYGIYKSSSFGAVKLEPTAFNGAFPVQVRFVVHRDCYPLPESVFKKAIKENYNNSSKKFDTELTVKQVKKLIELFRPVEVVSRTPAIHPQPTMVAIENREVFDGARESFLHSYEEPFARDPHTHDKVRRYSVLPRENDQHLPYREVPSTEKEEFRPDTFLSEKEYRTYGLRRERPNTTPPTSHIAPALEPYPRDHMRELRHPSAIYRDIAPPPGEPTRHDPLLLSEKEYKTYGIAPPPGEPTRHDPLLLSEKEYKTYGIAPPPGEPIHHDPLFLIEREYKTYGIGARWEHSIHPVTANINTLDSYPKLPHYSYAASSVDAYESTSRRDGVPSGYSLSGSRETYPIETDHLPRRETYLTGTDHLSRRGSYPTRSDYLERREKDDLQRLYSTHASSALPDYNRTLSYQEGRAEHSLAPVSSRYSFAGPSSSYH